MYNIKYIIITLGFAAVLQFHFGQTQAAMPLLTLHGMFPDIYYLPKNIITCSIC